MGTLKRRNANGEWEFVQYTGEDVVQMKTDLDKKATILRQDSEPVGVPDGTIWIDTSDNAYEGISLRDLDDTVKAHTAELGDVTTQLEGVTAHQADDVNHVRYAVATGTANAYAITLNPAPTAYVEGMAVSVKINVNATAASTLNVNGLGAKGIKKANGTDATNLKANGIYTLRYDGTNFILQGEGGSGNATASDLLSGKTASTDAGDITGTMPDNGAVTITPGATNKIIPAGYHNGSGIVQGDVDLIASNIRSGKDIFGVVGNLMPLTTEKKWATGVTAASSGLLTVTGLGFTPKFVIAKFTGTGGYPYSYVAIHGDFAQYGLSQNPTFTTEMADNTLGGTTFTSSYGQFSIGAASGYTYRWIAFE